MDHDNVDCVHMDHENVDHDEYQVAIFPRKTDMWLVAGNPALLSVCYCYSVVFRTSDTTIR